MLYASCPGLAILALFAFEMCVAALKRRKP